MDQNFAYASANNQMMGSAALPPQMTLTESTTTSLQSLLAQLNDSNARLQEARDRMFGAQPEAGAKDGPRPLPNGRADEIELLLAAVHTASERNSSLASELLRRL